jgi:predicted dehydrogenase
LDASKIGETGINTVAINIAIVGLGEVAQGHLKVWRKINNIRVAAVCDSNRLRAEKTAGTWGIPAYSDELSEILHGRSISIVDICTPPQAHCSLILQALEAGCHVIAEKPLTMTTDEAKTIISRHKDSQTKVTVIHNWLYVPVMRKALSLIKKGRLGEIIGMDIKVLHTRSEPMIANKDHWCHSLPGGRLGEMLAHPTYIIQALLGQIKLKSVLATKLGNYPWVNFDELRVSLEAKKGSASIYASFNSPRYDILIDIYGTEGKLQIDQLSDTLVQPRYRPLTIFSKGMDSLRQAYQLVFATFTGALNKFSGTWVGGPEFCLRAFADSVLNGKEPVVTLNQAYDTVELLEQICQEIESQRPSSHH